MKAFKMVAALVCVATAVHLVVTGGWSDPSVAAASGGDPATVPVIIDAVPPCDGGKAVNTCSPQTGQTCTLTYDRWEGLSGAKTRTKQPSDEACTLDAGCVPVDYFPAMLGCK